MIYISYSRQHYLISRDSTQSKSSIHNRRNCACLKFQIPGNEFCNIGRITYLFQRHRSFSTREAFVGSFYNQRRLSNVICHTHKHTLKRKMFMLHSTKEFPTMSRAREIAYTHSWRPLATFSVKFFPAQWSFNGPTFFWSKNLVAIV